MLDRNRSFGYVFGETDGSTFEQDGKLFDENGDEVVTLPTRGRPRKQAETDSVNDQLAAQV